MDSKSREYIAGQLCNEADELVESLSNMRQALFMSHTGRRWPSRLSAKRERIDHLLALARERGHRRWETWCDTQVDD